MRTAGTIVGAALRALLAMALIAIAALAPAVPAQANPSPSSEQRRAEIDRILDDLNSVDPATRWVTLDDAMSSSDPQVRRIALSVAFGSSDQTLRTNALAFLVASKKTLVLHIDTYTNGKGKYVLDATDTVLLRMFNFDRNSGSFQVHSQYGSQDSQASLAANRLSIQDLRVPNDNNCAVVLYLNLSGSVLEGSMTCQSSGPYGVHVDVLK